MGKVRARAETGKLLIDFTFQKIRCREQTALDDTPQNRKLVEKLLARIEAEITLGQFDYASYFPNSSQVGKFKKIETARRVFSGEAKPLFRLFAQEWFDEMQLQWRHSYKVTIDGLIKRRLIPHFAEMEVSDITKADLLKFRAELGGMTQSNGKTFSAEHVNRHMKVLQMILNEAADRFEFTSPFQGIKPLKKPKVHVDPFTLEEIEQILKAVRDDFRSYYTVRFFTGMRTGEIDGLKWKYVNFARRQILIRETRVMNREEYTKNDYSQREIEMSQPVYDALVAQRAATGHFENVFCTRNGTPLDHHNVTKRIWNPLLNQLGIPRRKPYQTRHTAATLWLAAGENPEWIARQMGHSTTEMLFRVYSRFVPNLTRQDGSAMERMLAANVGMPTTGAALAHHDKKETV